MGMVGKVGYGQAVVKELRGAGAYLHCHPFDPTNVSVFVSSCMECNLLEIP